MQKQGFFLCLFILAYFSYSYAQGGFATQISTQQEAEAAVKAAEEAARTQADSLELSAEPDSASQDSAAAFAAQQDSIAKAEAAAEAARQDSIAKAALQDSIAKAEAAKKLAPIYPFYEAYLDSIEAYALDLLPEIERLDSAKRAVSAEVPGPKSEYESQTAYDARVANFAQIQKQKTDNLEKEYQIKEKGKTDKLMQAVLLKDDIQPEWAGLLKKDTEVEGYSDRISVFYGKISGGKYRVSRIDEIFTKLLFNKSDSAKLANTFREKNFIYASRLQRAVELMKDYMILEQAKVLQTERRKVDMTLGAYDVDKQEFELDMSDVNSQTVPFAYNGKIKISPQQAQVIDRKTDDFTVSLDYINYPFLAGYDGAKLFPGVKKAHVFYKDQEFAHTGVFKNVPDFERMDNYLQWALFADSLISGKLAPKNLDSLYVMKKVIYKPDTGPSWWTAPRIIRVLALTAAAAGTGIAIWQNEEVKTKLNKAKSDFKNAEAALISDNPDYGNLQNEYNVSKSKLYDTENMRNGFAIGAGAFGLIGLVTFFF